MSIGDFRVERLAEWGVTRVYGYPGDGINAILGALAVAKGDSGRRAMIERSLEDKLEEFLPGRR